jgi:hypothetical protein
MANAPAAPNAGVCAAGAPNADGVLNPLADPPKVIFSRMSAGPQLPAECCLLTKEASWTKVTNCFFFPPGGPQIFWYSVAWGRRLINVWHPLPGARHLAVRSRQPLSWSGYRSEEAPGIRPVACEWLRPLSYDQRVHKRFREENAAVRFISLS